MTNEQERCKPIRAKLLDARERRIEACEACHALPEDAGSEEFLAAIDRLNEASALERRFSEELDKAHWAAWLAVNTH